MMYNALARFYPKNLQKKYIALLKHADIRVNPYSFMGFMLSSGFLLSLGTALFLGSILNFPFIILFAGIFASIEFLAYTLLTLKADSKGKFVNDILPDALQLMSSNLRAGFTIDRALLLSSRDEFGPFKVEIDRIGKEIATGKDISDALLTMTQNIKSIKLQRTVSLIVAGLKSGGELASLLEQTADNLRQEHFVEERIKSGVMMYVIFIGAAISFGAPMLFGLSSFLVEVLSSKLGNLDLGNTAGSMPMSMSEISISIDFIIMYSIVSLVSSGIMGSLILGLILHGKEREGLKMMPVLIAASVGIFFLIRIGIASAFGDLLLN